MTYSEKNMLGTGSPEDRRRENQREVTDTNDEIKGVKDGLLGVSHDQKQTKHTVALDLPCYSAFNPHRSNTQELPPSCSKDINRPDCPIQSLVSRRKASTSIRKSPIDAGLAARFFQKYPSVLAVYCVFEDPTSLSRKGLKSKHQSEVRHVDHVIKILKKTKKALKAERKVW